MKLQTRLLLYFLVIAVFSVLITVFLTMLITPLIVNMEVEVEEAGGTTSIIAEETTGNPIATQINQIVIIAGSITCLVAVFVSWYVSRRIIRPIAEIASATKRISDGQYDHLIDVNQNDEIGELASRFNQMAMTIAKSEKTRQQLIADVSHELKTPLASIQGMIEGFQDQIIHETPENYTLIYQELDRLQRLVKDLQDLSITGSGAIQLQRRWWPPVDIASAVIARMRSQYDTKSIELSMDFETHLPKCFMDRGRIEQVLINLLGNSLQYTDTGGQVRINLSQEDKGIRFAIHDTGIGLSGSEVKRIFQRFYRVDKSRSRLTGGSGIGLTIAKNIVDAHDGQIWAESLGLHQGTSIYFRIPISKRP